MEVRIPWVMAASGTMFSEGKKDIYQRIRTRPDWPYIALLFDAKYPLAAALARRQVTFREYDERVIFDPVVQALIDRIDLIPDISMGVFGAEAGVELTDGRVFDSRQDCIADFPVEEKLRIGAGGLLPRRRIEAILRAADHVDRYQDVGDFVALAAGR